MQEGKYHSIEQHRLYNTTPILHHYIAPLYSTIILHLHHQKN